MAHSRNMGYGPSRGRIRPERILRGGSTATDLSPRRLSWHTGSVPAEPINTLSGRTLGRSCKVTFPETSAHDVKQTHYPQYCGNANATTKNHCARYRCEEPPGNSAPTSNPKRASSRFCRL